MLFNLSLRYKLPIWGSLLIVVTALVLTTSLMAQAWDNLRRDTLKSAEDLGRTMARPLFTALLHDDVWRAYETVSLPLAANKESELAKSLLVLDADGNVYVSSDPELHPVLTDLDVLGSDYKELKQRLADGSDSAPVILDRSDIPHIFVALPIANDSIRLGTLIVAYDKELLWQRFSLLIERAVWITLLVLAVLLPINWYWGGRMVAPLRLVTRRLSRIGSGDLANLEPGLYPYRDEIGQLYVAYDQMAGELREKVALKQEVIKTERMAAVGRLTASIAHEINNPLGGMLNAISTLKRYGQPDPQTQKTIALLERGLSQIRETVAALLVEAKVKTRPLTRQDIEDVRVLVAPMANKTKAMVDWQIDLPESLALPSTLIRQVLINLAFNAIQAAGNGGKVNVKLGLESGAFRLCIENDGKLLSEEQRESLFEPFSRFSEHGHGLGLWICYQIVTQLDGEIGAETFEGLTRFCVSLPLEHEIATR